MYPLSVQRMESTDGSELWYVFVFDGPMNWDDIHTIAGRGIHNAFIKGALDPRYAYGFKGSQTILRIAFR